LRKRGKRLFDAHVAKFSAEEADNFRNEKATMHANNALLTEIDQ
jgi:hypothetical protein